MKKNTTTILIIAGAAAVAYYLYMKNKGGTIPNKTTSLNNLEENATDVATATTTDGTTATAIETPTGDTAVKLPGGVTITSAQAKKLKGKLKTAALTALTKLRDKKRKKTAVAGFNNLPILF